MSSSKPQKPGGPRAKPCPFFPRGKCLFGDRCKYRHDDPAVGGKSRANDVEGAAALDWQTEQLTWPGHIANEWADLATPSADWSKSFTNAWLESFNNDWALATPSADWGEIPANTSKNTLPIGSSSTPSSSGQRARSPLAPQPNVLEERKIVRKDDTACKQWARGRCKYGQRCKYRHGPLEASSSLAISTTPLAPQEPELNSTIHSQEASGHSHPARPRPSTRRVGDLSNFGKIPAKEKPERERKEAQAQAQLVREEQRRLQEAEQRRLQEEEKKKQEQEKKKEEQEKKKQEEEKEKEEQEKKKEEAANALAKQREEREQARRRAQEATNRKRLNERLDREAAVIEQFVVLDTSLVTCGAGLQIRNVVSGSELCRIRVKNVPPDLTKRELADVLLNHSLDPFRFFIASIRPAGKHQEVVVLTAGEDGQSIVSELEGIVLRGQTLAFEVSESTGQDSMDARGGKNRLTVVWYPATENVTATYDLPRDADRMFGELNGKTIDGQRLRCFRTPRHGFAFHTPNQIKVVGFRQGSYSDGRCARTCQTSFLTLEPPPTWTNESTFERLKAFLSFRQGVNMNTYRVINGNPGLGPLKVEVWFSSWDLAKAAFDAIPLSLQDRTLPKLRVFLPEPVEYVLRIPHLQYNAQARQWAELSSKPAAPDAPHVTIKRGDFDVFLRVDGKDQKAVGELKVRVEKIVAGERLDASFWNPVWLSGRGQDFLKSVRESTTVFVRVDPKARVLRLYGQGDRDLAAAREMIRAELDRRAEEEMKVSLDHRAVGFFVQKGLAALQGLLGEDNVSLNVGERTVAVRGGEEARQHLRRLLQQSKEPWRQGASSMTEKEENICPVCYDQATTPEELGCGHVYCIECLSHLIKEAKNFPLVCVGKDATCRTPLSLPLIHRFLTAQAFGALVDAAFIAYIEDNQDTYKYCPTPDCKQIYRVGVEGQVLTCPSCFRPTCAACGEEEHKGVTCAAWRNHKDPAEQDRLFHASARENNLLQCPSCQKWIQKAEGCNHMTCTCGAHFCWRCGKGFGSGQEVYAHLASEHGGYFDNPAPAPPAQHVPIVAPPMARPYGFQQFWNPPNQYPQPRVGGGIFGANLPDPEDVGAWDVLMQEQRQLLLLAERRREEEARRARIRAFNEEARRLQAERFEREQREREAARNAAAEGTEGGGWCTIM